MRRIFNGIAWIALAAVCPSLVSAQAPCLSGNCDSDQAAYDESGSCPDGSCGGGSLIERLRARCQRPGECVSQTYGNPDLFANYWAGPNCGGVSAQLYLAPQPVPAYVGHTFHTYQPLMPHEFLYPHKRTYHRYYDEGRGMNRTSVKWSKSIGYQMNNLAGYFSIAR